jgi:hypothetical protein
VLVKVLRTWRVRPTAGRTAYPGSRTAELTEVLTAAPTQALRDPQTAEPKAFPEFMTVEPMEAPTAGPIAAPTPKVQPTAEPKA